MSEIDDQGLLPPNVHHAGPEKPGQPEEDADRKRVAEGSEWDGDPDDDPGTRHPRTEPTTRHRAPEDSDDPYAKPGEDPYGTGGAATPERRESDDAPGRGEPSD